MPTRVLIVEDDADARNNLCDILEMDGYQTDSAATAVDAMERIDQASYDILIIDWHLTDTTAAELLPWLRHHAPDASILIATGSSDLQHAIHAMQHGVSDYIVKPICPELLLNRIQRARKIQIAQQRAIQSERLAAIGTAVARVAHESRNLLQRILARVELMRLVHDNNEDLQEDLLAIEDASSQLQSYFEELREFSAPIRLNKSVCGLLNIIQRVWNHVQGASASSSAKLSVPSHDVRWLIDSVRIEQVMRNLFENAIAASNGEARVEVDWIVCEQDDVETLSVTVRDHGPGFTQEQRVSAFEPFFTTKGHGTGLGLPICRRIVEAHGGSIDVDAHNCDGGAVTLTLPGSRDHRTVQAFRQEATAIS